MTHPATPMLRSQTQTHRAPDTNPSMFALPSCAATPAHNNGDHNQALRFGCDRRCRAPQPNHKGARSKESNDPVGRPHTTPTTPSPKACAPPPVLRAPRPVVGALGWPSTVARARWWPFGHYPPTQITAANHPALDGTRRLAIDQPHALEARARRRPDPDRGDPRRGGPRKNARSFVAIPLAWQPQRIPEVSHRSYNRNTPTSKKPTRVQLVHAPLPLGVRPRKRLRAGCIFKTFHGGSPDA